MDLNFPDFEMLMIEDKGKQGPGTFINTLKIKRYWSALFHILRTKARLAMAFDVPVISKHLKLNALDILNFPKRQ